MTRRASKRKGPKSVRHSSSNRYSRPTAKKRGAWASQLNWQARATARAKSRSWAASRTSSKNRSWKRKWAQQDSIWTIAATDWYSTPIMAKVPVRYWTRWLEKQQVTWKRQRLPCRQAWTPQSTRSGQMRQIKITMRCLKRQQQRLRHLSRTTTVLASVRTTRIRANNNRMT